MVCKESVNDEMAAKFNDKLKNSSVILIDVAGTTTPLSFVKDTLFPYVTANVKDYLTKNWETDSIKEVLTKLREESSELPKEGDKDEQLPKFVEFITKVTQESGDALPVKTIQGLIYQQGYDSGDLKGTVFDDVASSLQKWCSVRRVCVYSTGTIESQKLLFTHTSSGDLTPHITTHFDQTVGLKTEPESYKTIASKLNCETTAIAFLTDSFEEAKAASAAGVNAVLVNRAGNTPLTEEQKQLFPVVESFSDLPLNEVDGEVSAKRKLEADVTEPPAKIAKTEENGAEVSSTKKQDETEVSSTEEKMEVDEAAAPETNGTTDKLEEKMDVKEQVSSTTEKVEEEKKEIEETKPEKSEVEETKTETSEIKKTAEIVEEKVEIVAKEKEESTEIVAKEKEESTEIVEEKVKSTEVVKENVESTEMVQEKVESTEMVVEKVESTEIVKEKVESTEIVKEKVESTEIVEKKVESTEIVEEKVESTEIVKEKVKSTEIVEEKVESTEIAKEESTEVLKGNEESTEVVKGKEESAEVVEEKVESTEAVKEDSTEVVKEESTEVVKEKVESSTEIVEEKTETSKNEEENKPEKELKKTENGCETQNGTSEIVPPETKDVSSQVEKKETTDTEMQTDATKKESTTQTEITATNGKDIETETKKETEIKTNGANGDIQNGEPIKVKTVLDVTKEPIVEEAK